MDSANTATTHEGGGVVVAKIRVATSGTATVASAIQTSPAAATAATNGRGVRAPPARRGSSIAWIVGNSSTGARTTTATVVKPAASVAASARRAVASTGARFHTPWLANSSAADQSTGRTGAPPVSAG